MISTHSEVKMASNYLGEFPTIAFNTPQDWALSFLEQYGQIDGEHHKTWVLDQIARVLKGTPVITAYAKWGPSDEYPEGLTELRFKTGEPSKEYLAWVDEMLGETLEDGEREYSYDVGTPP